MMKANLVTQMIRWMRRSDSEFADITLTHFFRTAYTAQTGFALNDDRLVVDLAEFGKGHVPYYVVLFTRKVLYPLIVRENKHPQLPVIY